MVTLVYLFSVTISSFIKEDKRNCHHCPHANLFFPTFIQELISLRMKSSRDKFHSLNSIFRHFLKEVLPVPFEASFILSLDEVFLSYNHLFPLLPPFWLVFLTVIIIFQLSLQLPYYIFNLQYFSYFTFKLKNNITMKNILSVRC